jgi:DNA primase
LSFLGLFLEWANYGLSENQVAREYLLSRGVSEEQWARHKLGYIPGPFEVNVNQDPGHDPNVCGDKSKDYLWCDSCRFVRWSSTWEEEDDGFKVRVVGGRIKDCIVLPLSDYTGIYIGFQVRSIVDKVYDTFVSRHRPFGYFFGLAPNIHKIWSTRTVWLTEGAFDQLVIERLVTSNVLAITTSSIGKAQGRFLTRFTETVNWCADRDKAGRDGFKRFYKYYHDKIQINDISFPCIQKGDKDPGKFWERVGDEKFTRHFRSLSLV